MSPRKLLALLCLCFAPAFAENSNAQTKLLRFPDIHGDKVVFTYAGDLWLAATSGGLATRLTAHPLLRPQRFLSRWLRSRLLGPLPRFPNLEALFRRLGPTTLHFRFETSRRRKNHRRPARAPRSHVGRRQDFLFIGQGRHAQSLRLSRKNKKDGPAHPQHHWRRPLPQPQS